MVLQRLDSVIAFGVVMLSVSLIIMVLTQMVSALFDYRGTNLRWGLKTLLSPIDPRLAKDAETIAHDILTHPITRPNEMAPAPSFSAQLRRTQVTRKASSCRHKTPNPSHAHSFRPDRDPKAKIAKRSSVFKRLTFATRTIKSGTRT